jgi:hypothetical protein
LSPAFQRVQLKIDFQAFRYQLLNPLGVLILLL